MEWLKQAQPVSLFKRAISPNPWYVIIYITSHCNQRCNMCFNWEMLNTLKRDQEFTLDEIDTLSRRLTDLYQLTLSGGEPTLRKDLAEVVEVFCRNTPVKRITIATNGYYPDRVEALVTQVMQRRPDLTLSINMSLDGVGEKHDEIRGLKNSFDHLVRTYRTVKALQAHYPNLHAATASVVTVSNKESIADVLRYVDENMDIVNHGLMLARGDIPTDQGRGPEADFFIDILRMHDRMSRAKSRLNNAISGSLMESRIDTIRNQRMKDPCLAGKKLIIIDERANVHPCEILKVLAANGQTDAPELGDFCFGNLRDVGFDIDALLTSQRAKDIRQFIKDERCWCTFECAQINNFVLNPDAYLRTVAKYFWDRPQTSAA